MRIVVLATTAVTSAATAAAAVAATAVVAFLPWTASGTRVEGFAQIESQA